MGFKRVSVLTFNAVKAISISSSASSNSISDFNCWIVLINGGVLRPNSCGTRWKLELISFIEN